MTVYIVLLLASGWPVGDCYHKDRRIGNALYQLDSIASIAIGMAWMVRRFRELTLAESPNFRPAHTGCCIVR